MKCPACNETLLMSEKNGVEIDYCPKCRGIWLDRGELEKLWSALVSIILKKKITKRITNDTDTTSMATKSIRTRKKNRS